MKRRNGTVLARSGRTLREKSATASTIVPITNTPSTQRYGPTGYFPIASAKPTPTRAEQLLPAPRHRPDGQDHDRDSTDEVAEVRVHEDVQRLPDVDLPEDVRGAETGDDERRQKPD